MINKNTIWNKQYWNINWFTLIELIIAMSIFFIIVVSTYAPYNYYSQKARLNIVTKEISQSLYNARNIAINWSSDNSWNTSIWIYLDTTPWNNTKIEYFSYPYSFSWSQIIPIEWWNIKKIKTIKFSGPVEINTVWWKDNLLFFFSSISWSWWYYYYNNNPIPNTRHVLNLENIIINVSYKWTSALWLTKEIIYNTNTNIVDYN